MEIRQSPGSAPELSLVVPLFNQCDWLAGLFDSLFRQADAPRFEVILCDDGSSDDSLRAASRLAEQYQIDCRYVWQPDLGFRLSRSKNNGIRCASGRIVVFCDGDTWLGPSFLNDHVRAHETAGRLVCGSRYTKFVSELPSGFAWPQDGGPPIDGAIREPANQTKWLGGPWEWAACFGGNFSVERARCLTFDENFLSWGSEDRDLAYRLIDSGLLVFVLPEPNAIQWKLSGANWTDMSHEEVLAFLENKAYLASKYPGGELAPSVNLVRRCHLSDDGQWSIGPTRDISAADVFQQYRDWQTRRDRDRCP